MRDPQARCDGHSIPVVMVTGDAFDSDLQRAHSVGADAVLIKPYLPETVCSEIGRLLAKSRELRARGTSARTKVAEQLAKSHALIARSRKTQGIALIRAHQRHDPVTPPLAPPAPICLACDQPLVYQRSRVGGVSARNVEQVGLLRVSAGLRHVPVSRAQAQAAQSAVVTPPCPPWW